MACNEASGPDGVAVAANLNAPDQTVISGDPAAVDPRGRRVQVARREARSAAQGERGVSLARSWRRRWTGCTTRSTDVDFGDPAFPVLANASGEAVRTGMDAKRLLIDQLTAPVRWVACMQGAATLAPGARFIEIGPGSVLSGLLKRIVPGAPTVTLGTADEVETFLG